MRFPIIVLSYDDFAESKKLFFYEDSGEALFPIFTDPAEATEFRKEMQKVLYGLGDQRSLFVQVCESEKYLRDILEVISLVVPDLSTIIFDPSPPGVGTFLIGRNIKKDIKKVIQELSDSSNT